MAQELTGITEALDAFALSLKEGRYYEAHEDLEAIWYPRRAEDNDEVRLWKGFINAAVSFELLRLGRVKPSGIAWNTYLKYSSRLENLESSYYPLYVKIREFVEQERGILCPNF